jgi:hypothetical protein
MLFPLHGVIISCIYSPFQYFTRTLTEDRNGSSGGSADSNSVFESVLVPKVIETGGRTVLCHSEEERLLNHAHRYSILHTPPSSNENETRKFAIVRKLLQDKTLDQQTLSTLLLRPEGNHPDVNIGHISSSGCYFMNDSKLIHLHHLSL